MARRRKKSYSRRRRMSGVGAAGSMNFNTEIGALLGAAVGGFADKILPTTLNPKLVAGSKIVLGGVLSKSINNPIGKGIGYGMIGLGAYQLLSQFALFQGLGQTDDEMLAVSLDGIGADVLGAADYSDISTINGATDVDVVNGIGADVLGADDSDEYIM